MIKSFPSSHFPLKVLFSVYIEVSLFICVTVVLKLPLGESLVMQVIIINLTEKCIQNQCKHTHANTYFCISLFLFVFHSEYFPFICVVFY